jgi:hypothetical protein
MALDIEAIVDGGWGAKNRWAEPALMAGVADNARNDGGYVAPELSKPTTGHLLNRYYLTSSGATVARPGVPQSSGLTPLDRSMEQQDNRVDNSICTDC